MEAAPVTVTPTKSIDGETSFFTTSSQTVTDGTHIILPVVFPLPPGAPVPPPIPPEDGPGPGAPEAPDEPDKHEDSSSTTKGAEFCTKPTPMSIASLVTATPEASLNPFTGEPPDDKPSPECEHGKEVSIKGLDPETLNDLAGKFCKDGMGSTKSTLDMTALDPNADTMGLSVDFAYDQHTGNCPSTCVDSFKNIIETCKLKPDSVLCAESTQSHINQVNTIVIQSLAKVHSNAVVETIPSLYRSSSRSGQPLGLRRLQLLAFQELHREARSSTGPELRRRCKWLRSFALPIEFNVVHDGHSPGLTFRFIEQIKCVRRTNRRLFSTPSHLSNHLRRLR